MDYTINIAEEGLIKGYEEFIRNKISLLHSKEIFIWGASVRGTVLGIMLDANGINDFSYVDNDYTKWGQNIGGHLIFPPKEIMSRDIFVLVAVQYGTEIVQELINMNVKNYIWLETNTAKEFVDELDRKDRNKNLIFGEGLLENIQIGNKQDKSIKNLIWEMYQKEDNKVLSINCIGMEMIYNLLKILLLRGQLANRVLIFLNHETLTDWHHFLPRVQHVDVLEKINCEEVFLKEYISRAKHYSQNYMVEKNYSPQRTYDKEALREDVEKQYLLMTTLCELGEDFVEVQFLTEIVKYLVSNRRDICIVQMPVNYELGEKIYPTRFSETINRKNLFVKNTIEKSGGRYIDLSYLLEEKYFVTGVTIQDSITYSGKKILLERISDEFK